MDNESPKTIDWLAIRAAYETGVEPLRHIARLHGVSESVVHRKRTKEAWPRRHETGRIAPRPAPNTNQVDWLAVRHDYETGEFSVSEVARRNGCSHSGLQRQKELEHWQARRPAYPSAYGAGGKVAARLKAGLIQKLAAISAGLGLAEKIDLNDPLQGLHTLANAYGKILEAREKSDDDRDRLRINDATRDALAERLEALAQSWERKRDSGGVGSQTAGGD